MRPYGMDLGALRLREWDYSRLDRHRRVCVRYLRPDPAEARRMKKRERRRARAEAWQAAQE